MRKHIVSFFLILFLGLLFLSSGNLAAQSTKSSFLYMNSLYYPYMGWNNWTANGPYLPSAQLFSPIYLPYWNINQLLFPFSRSQSNSNYSEYLFSPPYVETSRSILPSNTLNKNHGLWYWPAMSPYWEYILGNQTLIYELINSGNPDTPSAKEIDFYQLWQKVAEAIENGLPRTAIEYLQELIPLAIEGEKYGLAMKAICKQLVLEDDIQGNKAEEKIIRLTEEIEEAPELLKPLLNLVLAQWYWHYYQNNRYRFSQRDTTVDINNEDFTTWDLPKLLGKIDELYTGVLSHEASLKLTSMEMFTDFFELGSVPVSYRPTLFDFTAFSAIAFYQDGDQVRISPEDAFEMDADSDAFAPAEIFLNYLPETTDMASPLLKATKLYQKLLDFHINDTSKEAFFDADINRLIFVNACSFGEEKSNRYMTRLSEIAESCSITELSSLAYYYWTQELYNRGNYVEAHEIAQRGKSKDPDSYGGKLCYNLLTKIKAKEMTLKSEYSMTSLFREVRLDYRNITKAHFRIVEDQWDDFLKEPYQSPGYISNEKFEQLLQKIPIEEWSVTLAPTTDYKPRSQAIDLPPLQPGYYSLISSWQENFGDQKNAINIVSFWVTEIAMVTKKREGVLDCFIFDAHQGAPIEGAQVKVFRRNSEGYYQEESVKYTDENGSFTIPNSSYGNIVLHAHYNGYELLSQPISRSYQGTDPDESQKTIFFTDRSIYRPGQAIHYKVLAIRSNQSNDTYDFLPNTNLRITFKDYNYQELDHVDVITNAFGSASGTFTAPSGTLTGRMTISCSQPSGSTSVQVEEYKRPTFKVDLNAPPEEGRLDEEINVSGLAMGYNGAPIDEAKVSYRVVRQVRYPYWCWWLRYRPSNSQEIAHGRLTTDAEGKFTVPFIARPDRSIPESDNPTFIFTVSVDVTDNAGETRSRSRSIHVGYVSMSLNIFAGDWLTNEGPILFHVSAWTLDYQPLTTSGTITVYKLMQPQSPVRPSLLGAPSGSVDMIDQSDWETWPEDQAIASSVFDTSEGAAQVSFSLEPGVYKVIAASYDHYGAEVTTVLPIMVLDPQANRFTVPIANFVKLRSSTLEVGDSLEALWGTGYQEGHAFVEIEHKGVIVKKYWTDAQNTQQQVHWSVGEEHRGGFFVHITQVHDNRAHISKERISVPWSNKNLEVSFSSFRSKLDPGAEETWTIQIKGPDAENAAAELAATLYDASLDAFLPHYWSGLDSIFRQDSSRLSTNFANRVSYTKSRVYTWIVPPLDTGSRTYIRFPDDVVQNYSYTIYYPYYYGSYGGYGGLNGVEGESDSSGFDTSGYTEDSTKAAGSYGGYGAEESLPTPEELDLSQIPTRTNFNETAFFMPHLLTDEEGQVSITFTIPDTLTTWKFMGFAHSQDLVWGMLSEEIITQKDLMVQPNPPRFLREGDIILFSAKVTNLSEEEQSGTIRLSLSDTFSEQSLDNEFLNSLADQPFSVPAKSSRSYFWEIEVPYFSGPLTYKVVASSGNLSDGEEDALPVLSRRILVTESLPLPVRGPEIKTFSFDKLLESGQSETLEHQTLTLQMVSNPAWYAVQSLPYLMEHTHECSEQIFNRLYANSLAAHIANSDPQIKQVFSQWQGTDALDSNLEKNEELKSVLLEETPWVRAAQRESSSKKRIGLLFDDEHMENSLSSAYDKLAHMQLSNGSWPWFPGGRSNFYITLYIMTGFGRLRHLNIDVNQELAIKCLGYLDSEVNDIYEKIKQYGDLAQNHLSSTIAMYLYGRSFYLDTHPIPSMYQTAVTYFLNQAAQYWLAVSARLSQGHLALACQRFNDQITAQKIMASLKERSVNEEELGMFWRDLELSWWWFKAPIETQAVMIEAFDEVANDQTAVEDLKIWLLKQKQTQNWKTTKSTADAVYALLLRGVNLLASDDLVTVTLGNLEIIPEDIEAGTGFYEKKFIREEVEADYGQVTVEKIDEGIAWGSIHWQYLEDMSKVTPHETPLSLEKDLFVERQTTQGPVIETVSGNLAVGDRLIVRIILRVDRDMEYVHMKDYRGSGTEPVNVLSHYKFQDGLAYYEATKDTATHFFIDYLPKGTYVFEYPLRIQHRGEYQMGIATIQCMYAPEFNSHSESIFITVQ